MATEPAFIQTSRAWYAGTALSKRDLEEEFMVGLYGREGGCDGEFAIRFEVLGGRATPRVCLFDDAWHLFNRFQSLFASLPSMATESGADSVTPDDIRRLLLGLGFVDLTETKPED